MLQGVGSPPPCRHSPCSWPHLDSSWQLRDTGLQGKRGKRRRRKKIGVVAPGRLEFTIISGGGAWPTRRQRQWRPMAWGLDPFQCPAIPPPHGGLLCSPGQGGESGDPISSLPAPPHTDQPPFPAGSPLLPHPHCCQREPMRLGGQIRGGGVYCAGGLHLSTRRRAVQRLGDPIWRDRGEDHPSDPPLMGMVPRLPVNN